MYVTTMRHLQVSDIDSVVALEKLSFPHPWSKQNFLDSLSANDECWVMLLDGELIGHGVMTVVCEDATLLNIAVMPKYQGCGLGKRLLNFLLDVVVQQGAKSCFLEVRPSNENAIALYRNFGFNIVGRRKNYYPGHEKREDALVMQLELHHAHGTN